MGFFSGIINDAQRAPTAAFRPGAGPGGENIQEHSLDDPGHVVTEAHPQYQAEEMAAAPRPDARQGARNPDGAVQPPAITDSGRSGREAVVAARGRVAEPDSLTSVASLGTGGKQIGSRIEPQNPQVQIEAEPAGLLRPAMAEAIALTQRAAPGRGAVAVPDLAVKAGDGYVEQEQRQVAMPRQPVGIDLQLVAPQRADAGVEAVAAAPASRVATEAASPPGIAEYSTLAQQEAAIQGSVESRPVTPAPAAMDVSPARRPGPGQGATLNTGPQVHIGHIDIVVLAPEQAARPLQPPASADLASRHYLRRL